MVSTNSKALLGACFKTPLSLVVLGCKNGRFQAIRPLPVVVYTGAVFRDKFDPFSNSLAQGPSWPAQEAKTMALPPYEVILIQELMQGEQEPICVCANSYVAVAYLQREAADRGIPLDVRHTNKHYAIGSHEYGFTELRLYDMAWLRQ